MSIASLFDSWFIPSNQQTPAEAQANYQRELNLLAAQGQTPPPGDGPTLEDPGAAASQTFFSSIGSGGDSTTNGPGIGSVLTDVLIIGTIGAAIWAFFNFGGVGFLKSLAAKSKWWVVGILAGVALLLWFIWQQFQKTASDTQSTLSGITAGLSALNPFSSTQS